MQLPACFSSFPGCSAMGWPSSCLCRGCENALQDLLSPILSVGRHRGSAKDQSSMPRLLRSKNPFCLVRIRPRIRTVCLRPSGLHVSHWPTCDLYFLYTERQSIMVKPAKLAPRKPAAKATNGGGKTAAAKEPQGFGGKIAVCRSICRSRRRNLAASLPCGFLVNI